MDERAIRTMLIEGLEAGAVTKASRGDFRGAFIAGTVDSALAALEMDSLAKMELCIAIEVGSGVSLAPEELERFGSLGDLAAEIARRTGA